MGGNASSVRWFRPAWRVRSGHARGAAQFGSRRRAGGGAEVRGAQANGRAGRSAVRPRARPGGFRPADRPGPEPTVPGVRSPAAPVMARSSVRSCTPAARPRAAFQGARRARCRSAGSGPVGRGSPGRPGRPAGLASGRPSSYWWRCGPRGGGRRSALWLTGVRAARVRRPRPGFRLHSGESIWQVLGCRPSAVPGAVGGTDRELNDLGSPSVRGGESVLSPIGDFRFTHASWLDNVAYPYILWLHGL